MEISTFITLLFIGLLAGIASGYVGIGGGIIIIPALIYFLGLGQHQAQGVSLALMLPPIGVLAFYKYYQSGAFNLEIEGEIYDAFTRGNYIEAGTDIVVISDEGTSLKVKEAE